MTDSLTMGATAERPLEVLAPIGTVTPLEPFTRDALVERLRLTLLSAGYAVLGIPVALVLAIFSVLAVPLSLTVVGLAVPLAVVPATEALTRLHRHLSGALLAGGMTAAYAPTGAVLGRPFVWLRDPARWRDVGFVWFSGTGGFVMSALPVALLTAPITHLVVAVSGAPWAWWLLVVLDGPLLLVWWLTTPALVRARAVAESNILDHGAHERVEQLERRVEEVSTSRTETLDAGAAEVRRIERDLHDGAQARMTAVGANVGIAEKLLETDPAAAAAVLREVRETTLAALADLRTLVRGIHPPVLADLGLGGGVEALAGSIPLPVTVAVDLPGDPPDPVESAVYFAVAEALANVVKHAGATRAWVTLGHADGVLRAVVGDDGRGGAVTAAGEADRGGLAGLRRRLAAFDGTMTVSSPDGGPTEISLEVPCDLSSPRTRPSSEPG